MPKGPAPPLEFVRADATLARDRGLRWIRWDAYTAPAGAAAFYEKCGARRIDETVLRGVGLAIFELGA